MTATAQYRVRRPGEMRNCFVPRFAAREIGETP